MLKILIRLITNAKLLLIVTTSFFTIILGNLLNEAKALPFNQISQVFFFGDSLTDSGFNDLWPTVANPPTIPPLPAGKAPTFTTFGGYTWAQYIARDIKGFVLPIYPGPNPPDTITNNSIFPVPGFASGTLNGIDYAAGGSTTNSIGVIETWAPSLHQQVSQFLSTAPAVLDANAVYFIWSGANDILGPIFAAPPIPTQLDLLKISQTAANNIANEVTRLSARGAKRFVVISLPNLGVTPLITRIAAATNNPSLITSMKNITFTFNSMLNTTLGSVIKQRNIKVLYIDVYTLLDNIIIATRAGQPYVIAGQTFRFVNASDPACSTVPSAIYCPSTAPQNYIFADTLHPSDLAHRALSVFVEAQIQSWKA